MPQRDDSRLLVVHRATKTIEHRHLRELPQILDSTFVIVANNTGVFVLPAVPYLQGLRLERDALVQALGLCFTVSTLALAASLLLAGEYPAGAAGTSVYALVPAMVGMWAGQWLRGRIRAQTFRRCFFVGLFALGLHLMLRAFIA